MTSISAPLSTRADCLTPPPRVSTSTRLTARRRRFSASSSIASVASASSSSSSAAASSVSSASMTSSGRPYLCDITTSIASFSSKLPSSWLDSCVPRSAPALSERVGSEKSRLRQALGLVRRAPRMEPSPASSPASRPSVVQERPGEDANGAREGASPGFIFFRGGDGSVKAPGVLSCSGGLHGEDAVCGRP